MRILCYATCVIVLFIFSLFYLCKEKWFRNNIGKLFKANMKSESLNLNVSYENAKLALEYISSWTTWLTGIQTAAIGAIGLIVTNDSICISNVNKNLAFSTILFFGFSIILSTFLLCSIPSIQQRLVDSKTLEPKNDIYEQKMFTNVNLTLQHCSSLVHAYFCIGIFLFATFVCSVFI